MDFNNTKIAFERKSNAELQRMVLLFKMMNNTFLVNIGSQATLLALKLRFPVIWAIKKTIFKQFCGGATFEECRSTIQELAKYEVATILDYGAEAKSTEEDFDKTVEESLRSISFAAENDTVPVVSCKITGLTTFALLEKITAKESLSQKEQKAYDRAKIRLDKICKEAFDKGVALFIDAEESWIQDAIDQMADQMMQVYNKDAITVYNTYQLYRHDRLAFLKESYARAQKYGYILGAKLVRGAYMEKENVRAQELNYPTPIQPNKEACDKDYNDAIAFCVENYKQIASCVASHNEYSTKYQMGLMKAKGIDFKHPHFNFCQLYGMSDNLTFNLAKLGFNVGKYVPYGPVRDVIPYLIRRARENSAVDGEMSRELNLIKQEIKRRKQA